MAHIVSFSIDGLAGQRRNVSRRLDRHLNVFFGRNGSGKTSLLRILDAAMSCTTAGLVRVPFDAAEVLIYSEAYKQTFTYTLERNTLPKKAQEVVSQDGALFLVGSPESVEGEWSIAPDLPPTSTGRWSHEFLPISRMYSSLAYGVDTAFLYARERAIADPRHRGGASVREEQMNDAFAAMLRNVWIQYYATIQEQVRRAQAEGLASILRAVLSAREDEPKSELDPHLAYDRTKSFLRRQGSPQALPSPKTFNRRYADDPRLRSVVSDVDQVEREIEAAMAPRTKLQELIGRLFTGKSIQFGENQVEVVTDKRSPLDLGQLSSGEKQVLLLLVEALKVEGNTLIIDEPELSMHVDWQQVLIASIRELNSAGQLVIATHSPEIMADIDDTFIFSL